jgi:sugar lactone lactonase YvrE
VNDLKSETLVDGLTFPEGPRWYEGKLWFSDQHAHRVMTVDLDGTAEVVVTTEQRPSGLGFLPDGTPLIVSMPDRLLLRLDGDGLHTLADLKEFGDNFANDMVTDRQGRSYVGIRDDKPQPNGRIVLVEPDGKVRVVADEISSPNGTVITPDGHTLVVAETAANKLTAFDVAGDGSLSNRRVFAELGVRHADGICLDAQGGVWFGSPQTREYLRVVEGGGITDRVKSGDRWGVAPALGGADRRTLFLCNSLTTIEDMSRLMTFTEDHTSISVGWIETVKVDISGAGWP